MVKPIACDLQTTTMSNNLIIKYFFRTKFKIAIKYADLKKDDVILDFGCGKKWLKRSLPEYNVIGYDGNPSDTEVDDYRNVKASKIFALDVLEHVPKDVVKDIVHEFHTMNPEVLIVIIPTENWVSRKARKLLGKPERVPDHITTLQEILPLLRAKFDIVKKTNFLTVSYIAKCTPKRL